MVSIEMDKSGLDYTLTGLDAGLRDLTPVWKGPVRDIFTRFIRTHFTSQGSYSGERWVPLSPDYAEWKSIHYPGKGILQREGDLYESLQGTGPDAITRIEPMRAEYGTKRFYAVYHQAQNRGKATFPRRLVIPPLTKVEGKDIVDAIMAFLFSKMRKKGVTPP